MFSLVYTVQVDLIMAAPNIQDRVGKWIREYVPRGATIGLDTQPFFYTPPLDNQRYRLLILGHTADVTHGESPDYIIVSSVAQGKPLYSYLIENQDKMAGIDFRGCIYRRHDFSSYVDLEVLAPSNWFTEDWKYTFLRIYVLERVKCSG